MIAIIANKVAKLIKLRDYHKVIESLIEYIEKTNITDELGWALWNICDCFACLRKGDEQFKYHEIFFKFATERLYPNRLHWVVCDTTQALTLITHGYGDQWWDWYQYANNLCPKLSSNRNIRFESHKAALSSSIYFKDQYHSKIAMDHMENILKEDPECKNYSFADLTYKILSLKYSILFGNHDTLSAEILVTEIIRAFSKEIRLIKTEPDWKEQLIGSWERLNAVCSDSSLFVALNNLACCLVDISNPKLAIKCFEIVLTQTSLNTYSLSLYLRSLLSSGMSLDTIRNILSSIEKKEGEKRSRKKIFIHVPELQYVLNDL